MNRIYVVIAAMLLGTVIAAAQDDHIADGLRSIAAIAGETKTMEDSVSADAPVKDVPLWKQKLYYGYYFDIYYHQDSKTDKKENGWSIAVTPEIGWRLKERMYIGLRLGGTYQDTYSTYTYEKLDGTKYNEDLRVMYGSWDVTPYMRYRLKTLFHDKVGIWLEGHLYAGMEFPRVMDGTVKGTDYEGLRHNVTYGAQLSPVITYQFNKKSTFQIFFSIMSFGYSGTTRFYEDPSTGNRHNEFSNDVILFSGKLKNMIANQFTPGLYGLKFGVQKSF